MQKNMPNHLIYHMFFIASIVSGIRSIARITLHSCIVVWSPNNVALSNLRNGHVILSNLRNYLVPLSLSLENLCRMSLSSIKVHVAVGLGPFVYP